MKLIYRSLFIITFSLLLTMQPVHAMDRYFPGVIAKGKQAWAAATLLAVVGRAVVKNMVGNPFSDPVESVSAVAPMERLVALPSQPKQQPIVSPLTQTQQADKPIHQPVASLMRPDDHEESLSSLIDEDEEPQVETERKKKLADLSDVPLMHINKIYSSSGKYKKIQRLAQYYGNGADIANSEYMKEISALCTAQKTTLLEKVPNGIMVFDIDGTMLFNTDHYGQWIQSYLSHRVLGCSKPCCQMVPAEEDSFIVIEPVRDLWNARVHAGLKNAIISLSHESQKESRLEHLQSLGFVIPEDTPMLLTPHEQYELIAAKSEKSESSNYETGQIKLAHRQELAKKYTIVGNIGDWNSDFAGGENGIAIKLPNLLTTNE